MFPVYAISSLEHNYIYVGMTSNLEGRLLRHNKGYERTTKAYAIFERIDDTRRDPRMLRTEFSHNSKNSKKYFSVI